MSLQQDLENFKAEFALKAPEAKKQTYEEFIAQLGNSDLLDQALSVGEPANDITESGLSQRSW